MVYDSDKFRLGSLCKYEHDFNSLGQSLRYIKGCKNCVACKQLIQKKHYEKNKEKHNESTKQWYEKNKEKHNEMGKQWRGKNKEKHRQLNRDWYQKNREKVQEKCRNWREQNPLKVKATDHKHRVKRNLAVENSEGLTASQIEKIYEVYDNHCAYCYSKKNLTLDHFEPLARGGKHEISNMVLACKKCNCSKNAKFFEEWYPRQPFYSIALLTLMYHRKAKLAKLIE